MSPRPHARRISNEAYDEAMINMLPQTYTLEQRARENTGDSRCYDRQQPSKLPSGNMLPKSRIVSASGSMIQYIKGTLATLPYLGFLAPEEPESEERLDPTRYIYQLFPERQPILRKIEMRPAGQEYLRTEVVYPRPSPLIHSFPSSSISRVQSQTVVDESPTPYALPNQDHVAIDWITEPEPRHIHLCFPLGRPTHHERPYSSTSYAPAGSTVWYTTESPFRIEHPPPMEDEMELGHIYVHRDLETDEQQVWVYRGERGWVVADTDKDYKHASMRHPTDQLRVLRMRPRSKEPGWVLITGYQKLVSRDRRRELGFPVAQKLA